MKKWIRNKLISFLGIDTLEKELREENEKLKERLSVLDSLNSKIMKDNVAIIEQSTNIVSQFNLSADIYHRNEGSWAIISIQGKPEYVRFVNLSNQDMRTVHQFLKQFERCNRTIDSPFTFLRE